MPQYDFRCKSCSREFTLNYTSMKAYADSTPICLHCESRDLARLITSISVKNPSRDYTNMSSQEMLSVFDSGDSRQVGEMFQQIGGTSPELGAQYHDATQKLLAGESMDKVERGLQEADKAKRPPKSDSNTT